MNDPNGVRREQREGPTVSIDGQGYVGKDCFGRVFFDACESELQHLANPPKKPGAERPGCRVYLDDLIPEKLIGKDARVIVTLHYEILEKK